MRILPLIISLGLAVAVSTSASANGAGGEPSYTTWYVVITDSALTPASKQANLYETVTWTNHSHRVVHCSTLPKTNLAWDSGTIADGQSVSYTFKKSGRFEYHCTSHRDVKGTIFISPKPLMSQ